MTEIMKYADASMFDAAPMQGVNEKGAQPKVHLLWMTPDPLGAIAAACRMYEGIPTYSLSDITDKERRKYADDVQRTHLKAPLEFVKFHFFVEGVNRAFTHQEVRQRTAVFAQESMRFAVKGNMAAEATVPPSIRELPNHHPTRQAWDAKMKGIEEFYNWLVAQGVPAEDARDILPHATSTRLNYCTDLRNLSDHAGNRLCTQAQFVWRDVFTQFVEQIELFAMNDSVNVCDEWQFKHLTEMGLFKPVCYQLGHCPFNASFDRGCTIRKRVDFNAKYGVDTSLWGETQTDGAMYVTEPINDAEWQMDRKAAWQ